MIGVGPRPVRRHLGDRGGLRGVRPGDARGGRPSARRGLRLPDPWWWTEGDEYVGRISLRHELNDASPRVAAATSGTTYAAAGAGRDTRPRCSPPCCVEAHAQGHRPGAADLRRGQPRLAAGDRGQRRGARGPARARSCATGCRPPDRADSEPVRAWEDGRSPTSSPLESSPCPPHAAAAPVPGRDRPRDHPELLHHRAHRPRQVDAGRPDAAAHRRGRRAGRAGAVPRPDGHRARARHHHQEPGRADAVDGAGGQRRRAPSRAPTCST